MSSTIRYYIESILRTEQSIKRDNALAYINSKRRILIQHILKIALFGLDCSAVDHWYGEIVAWCNTISSTRLKPKNRRLKLDDIKENLYKEWLSETQFIDLINTNVRLEKDFAPINYDALIGAYYDFLGFLEKFSEMLATKDTLFSDIESSISAFVATLNK